MKECFGKMVTSLDKARECRICLEFDACTQMLWEDRDESEMEMELAGVSSSGGPGSEQPDTSRRRHLLSRLTRKAG